MGKESSTKNLTHDLRKRHSWWVLTWLNLVLPKLCTSIYIIVPCHLTLFIFLPSRIHGTSSGIGTRAVLSSNFLIFRSLFFKLFAIFNYQSYAFSYFNPNAISFMKKKNHFPFFLQKKIEKYLKK